MIFPLFGLHFGALLALALAAFLFEWAFSGRLATLGGYHYGLRGSPNVIFQRREFIRPTIQFLYGYRRV